MKYLLDTQIILWYVSANVCLPARIRAEIENPANGIYLSIASVWEATIKYQLGKLLLPAPADKYLPAQRIAHGVDLLLVDELSMPHLMTLPKLHRDPFHRILMAQTLQFGLTLATVDTLILQYPIATLAG